MKLPYLLSLCTALGLLSSCSRTTSTTPSSSTASVNTAVITEPAPEPLYRKPHYEYVATTEFVDLDESRIERVIHVNPSHPSASSRGKGSEEQPFDRIAAAHGEIHNSLKAGIPTKLLIYPGVYREDIRFITRIPKDANDIYKNTLLVMEGSEKGKVTIKGSFEQDPQLGDFRPQAWKAVEGSPGLYVNDWPFDTYVDGGPWINTYGFALLPGVMQRSEMIWVNGTGLRQVLSERYRWEDPDGKQGVDDYGAGTGGDASNKPGTLVFDKRVIQDPRSGLPDPGTFTVFTAEEVKDELHGKVFLRLPEGLSIDEVNSIEVARWKNRSWSPMLLVANKRNFVMRNLNITHGTMGQMGTAVTITNSENFLVEDCDFSGNVASGFQLNNSRRGHLLRIRSSFNGGNGMNMGNGTRQILMEDCETSFNNLRGGWAGWLGWHASGFKSGNVHNITVRRHVSVGNQANGIWYDVYCTNVLIEDSFIYGNKRMGVMYELTRPHGGPQILRNSICAENDNTGVYITMAANSRVEDCLIIRNGGGGYVETDRKNTQLLYKFRDHPHGPNSAEEWEHVEIARNRFLSDVPGSRAVDYLDRKAEPLTQYQRVLSVLHSRDNQYGTVDPDAFRLPNGNWSNYAGWLELLKEHNSPEADLNSSWELSGLDSDRRREFSPDSTSEISQIARLMGVPLPQEQIETYWQRTDEGYYSPPYLHYERQHD